jgi:hypothetical protein
MIPVFAIYNEKQKVLADYFSNSIGQFPNFSLQMFPCQETEDHGMTGFKKYHRIVDFKLKKIFETLCENHGEKILWSDVDVQFLNDPTPELNRKQCDLLAMLDNPDGTIVNGGFLYIDCNERTIEFWQSMIRDKRKKSYDLYEQDMMNKLLRERKMITVSFLPPTFWCHHLARPQGEIIVHHATTDHHKYYPNGIVAEKLRLLKRVGNEKRYGMI